jgi:hypothetical protein
MLSAHASGYFSRSFLTSVPLPTPEKPEITVKTPFLSIIASIPALYFLSFEKSRKRV